MKSWKHPWKFNWKNLAAMLCCAALVTPCVARAQAAPANGSLNKVLAEMDEAAAKFRSAQADFQWDQFERVVSSTDTQKGTIYFLRFGQTTQMAASIKELNGQPAPKTIVYEDGVLKLFQPEINQMTVFHAGENQGKYESFLTLGFGGSGSDLKKNWEITDQGTEMIDGVRTVKLDLVGKEASVRNTFEHVTIWVDPTRAISLKQEFFEPSGDTRTDYFRNIQYNKKIPSSVFNIKTNSKTQVIQK